MGGRAPHRRSANRWFGCDVLTDISEKSLTSLTGCGGIRSFSEVASRGSGIPAFAGMTEWVEPGNRHALDAQTASRVVLSLAAPSLDELLELGIAGRNVDHQGHQL